MVRAPAARSLNAVTDRSNAWLGGMMLWTCDSRQLLGCVVVAADLHGDLFRISRDAFHLDSRVEHQSSGTERTASRIRL